MRITINGIEHETKFTFNSFRYMEDFDVTDMQELERKPFKAIKVLRELLLGALNADPKTKVTPYEVNEYVESIVDGGEKDITEMLGELISELTDSNFFKSLQKTPTKAPKRAKK